MISLDWVVRCLSHPDIYGRVVNISFYDDPVYCVWLLKGRVLSQWRRKWVGEHMGPIKSIFNVMLITALYSGRRNARINIHSDFLPSDPLPRATNKREHHRVVLVPVEVGYLNGIVCVYHRCCCWADDNVIRDEIPLSGFVYLLRFSRRRCLRCLLGGTLCTYHLEGVCISTSV